MGLLLNRSGSQTFIYDSAWLYGEDSYPISLSLPLVQGEHPPRLVGAFFWGMLPDNEEVLRALAIRHGTRPRSLMGLLAAVGSDCPGAIRVLTEDTAADPAAEPEGITWLSEAEVARRLRSLASTPLGRTEADTGQFSLAGAQPKTAFIRDPAGRYGIPHGRIPTTHILKPPTQGLDGFSENEHFCLSLARALGLRTAESRVERFEDQAAIVVKRYDRRLASDGQILRVHQEDCCQALGIPPENKYQSLGGPGPEKILNLLERSNEPKTDKMRFLTALAFNWVVGGTDAHAKNYSVLIAPGQVRLAPLYDIASATAYPDLFERRGLKMAMKIDGRSRFEDVRRRHWERLANAARLDPDAVLDAIGGIATQSADAASDIAVRCRDDGLDHPILSNLVDAVAQGSAAALRQLDRA